MESLAANEAAAAADERRLARSREPGGCSSGSYPHNLHFGLTPAQMAGKADRALAAAAGKRADRRARGRARCL